MAKVAIVTGGTRGIGAAIAKGLKASGATVAATYHGNDEAALKFRGEAGVAVFKWDVADVAASAEGIRRVEGELGPVDILVNNAGVTRDAMFHRMGWDQWSAVIRTNLDSMFAMTRPVIEGMRERNHGRIVNISSINGQKGQMGQANYSASKAGIIGFTKALAQENARKGITVNAICPGYIDTDMVAGVPPKVLESIVAQIPLGRLGKADEIASLVVYLASDAAAFMTGAVLTVNGGQYLANG
jgi:acetoacetyl-CoA reductase